MTKNSILILLFVFAFSFLKADIVTQEIAAKAAKNHFSIVSNSENYKTLELALLKLKKEVPFIIFLTATITMGLSSFQQKIMFTQS